MNEFREKLLGGKPVSEPLLRSKAPKDKAASPPNEESFADMAIPREAARSANHRDADRHRLAEEEAVLIHDGREQAITLVNLSGGGAMLEGAAGVRLWDRVELQFGTCGRLEAIVRWVRGERIGVEFAHETRIEARADLWAETLRAVIRRSFPDIALEAPEDDVEPAPAPVDVADSSTPFEDREEREIRHPLIWSGLVHYNHDSTPVRLRNISAGGALIEGPAVFSVGSELLLDLDEAGAIFGSVHWSRGDQTGIKFHNPFDLSALAKARPEVAASRWVAPDYLREDRSCSSPWDAQWDRSDVSQLHRRLEARRPPVRKR